MLNKVLIGPYIGDFKHEIMVYIPYVNYLVSSLQVGELFISSHYNRSFLYDHIPNKKFIPIFSNITRDELNQNGYTYNNVDKSQYNKISKIIKNDIKTKESYTLPYIKSTNTISYYQKEYKPFIFPKNTKTDKIVLISNKTDELYELYLDIKDVYDIDIIGDMNNGIHKDNITLKKSDYFDVVYKSMFESVHTSTMVITNCPEWAMICNLQNIPLLYWGEDSSMYKSDGIYGFRNTKILSTKHLHISMVKYMYDMVKE